jgi:hypothetical protein
MHSITLAKHFDNATRLHFQTHPTHAFAEDRLVSRGKDDAIIYSVEQRSFYESSHLDSDIRPDMAIR